VEQKRRERDETATNKLSVTQNRTDDASATSCQSVINHVRPSVCLSVILSVSQYLYLYLYLYMYICLYVCLCV